MNWKRPVLMLMLMFTLAFVPMTLAQEDSAAADETAQTAPAGAAIGLLLLGVVALAGVGFYTLTREREEDDGNPVT